KASASITEIEELHIGHNIVARSVFVGMEKAVKDMLASIDIGVRLRRVG
ncbi:MAG: pyridoxine 5'-phosphate synthase, partial [Nitrospinae bacterium]|nr:pyridoxine 5'-phosphate synthase [Nitrospinota bacterium]